ncbi:ParM/StbA family protein [Abyssibacter profundi]|nr:ParM/StbA family protein [Abyssibacter profundi]
MQSDTSKQTQPAASSMKVIGVDIGFGFTKVTDGKQVEIFKSVLGDPADIQFRESLLDASGQRVPHRHIETEDGAWFVGELAEAQSRGRSFTLDQDKLIAGFLRTLTLTALSDVVDDGSPIRLVTGLPISYYRRHKNELIDKLQQRHSFTMIDQQGQRVDRTLNIERVRVIPQPFGTMFHLLLNDFGRASDRRLATEKIGIIDVGFKTADYTISDKTRYSERGSQSTDAGISKAFKSIAAALHEKSGVNVELYRLYDAVGEGSIKIRGRTFDLEKITAHAMQRLATSIATEVNQLWADDWDIDSIVVTGGGGAALAPYLNAQLVGQVLEVESGEDTRLNNVRGYQKYGMHLWQK